MNTAGHTYVLSATIAFMAMVNRMGWIDWPTLGHVAVAGMATAVGIVLVLILTAIVIGVPVTLVSAVTFGLIKRIREDHVGEPQA